MKKRPKDAAAEISFEQALEQLEKVVQQLEGGDLPLERSLKLYEDGVRLSRLCSEKLETAERRIEILERARDGALRQLPFSPESGEE